MTIIQSIILGFIQGITEFLPISSSGHLILVPYIFGWDLQDITFDLFLHLGTTFAVLVFFWKDWVMMVKSLLRDAKTYKKSNSRLFQHFSAESKLFLIILAVSVPVGLVALIFNDTVENYFRNPLQVASMLLIAGLIMMFADMYAEKNKQKSVTNVTQVGFKQGLIVSLSQILALIPGTSRSGMTISMGLFQKFDRETAAKFSFLLATPIIVAGGLYSLKEIVHLDQQHMMDYLVGFLTAFLVGILAIKFLMMFLKTHRLTIFIIYRFVLGAIIIFLVLK